MNRHRDFTWKRLCVYCPHFREIADQGAGVLLITHDLELALKTADRDRCFLCRNCSGRGSNCGLLIREAALRHPYTRALFRAMPEHGFASEPGIQPYVRDLPEGCPYGPRCPKHRTECSQEVPYVPYQGDGCDVSAQVMRVRFWKK